MKTAPYRPVIAHDARAIPNEDVVSPILQRYFKDLAALSILTPEEELEIVKRLPAPEAKQKLIEANLRLVVASAKLYNCRGVEIQDIIQEGNIGLLTAIEKFDPAHGVRFPTYAIWWVHQAMQRAIGNHARLIRLPFNLYVRSVQERRAVAELHGLLGRHPSHEEIAARMEVSLQKVLDLAKSQLNSSTVSIDIDAAGGVHPGSPHAQRTFQRRRKGSSSGGHEVEAANDESPAMKRAALKFYLAQDPIDPLGAIAVNRALSRLERHQDLVLRLRFGFDSDEEEWTLEQIGDLFGFTRQRILQIERAGLRRLKEMMGSKGRWRDRSATSEVETWLGRTCGWCRTSSQAPFCGPMCARLWWRRGARARGQKVSR